jgi:hypothetical protein
MSVTANREETALRLRVESHICTSHLTGWARDGLDADRSCLVLATEGAWMERDADHRGVTGQ